MTGPIDVTTARDHLARIAAMPRMPQRVMSGVIRDTITIFDDDIADIDAYLAEPEIVAWPAGEDLVPDKHAGNWWAYCFDLDVLGDGGTREAAIANCKEGIEQKRRIMERMKP